MAHAIWWFAATFFVGVSFGLLLSALFQRFASRAEPLPEVIRPRSVGTPGPMLVARRR